VVEKVERDPDRDSFIDIIVKPAAHIDRLDEVLVVTSTQPRFSPQQQQDLNTSEALMGAQAAALKEQKKASDVMAERLPGLTDPNAPAAAQPATGVAGTPPAGKAPDAAAAATPGVPPAPKLLKAQHPDRYSPGAGPNPADIPLPPSTDSKPAPPRRKP
jgi:rod shape-determining protein MreC